MLLLITFLSTGSLEQVPDVKVVQIKAPSFSVTDGGFMTAKHDDERTRKNCEAMGKLYVDSLAGKLDSGTQVVVTCLGEILIQQSSSQ